MATSISPNGCISRTAIVAGRHKVACGFRDHALSDLIGFSYASWSADGAADDFVVPPGDSGPSISAPARAGERRPSSSSSTARTRGSTTTDRAGRFCGRCTARLASHPEIKTVTMAEACAAPFEHADRRFFPGRGSTATSTSGSATRTITGPGVSWLRHGGRSNRGARHGCRPTRSRALARKCSSPKGSDWFWWYGDDHSSEHDPEFDDLFRRHVRNVYRALDQPVPEELFVTNITTQPPAIDVQAPTGFIEPTIDGEVTSYFEWMGAGRMETAGATTMHRSGSESSVVELVEFGFTLDRLFIRLEGARAFHEILKPGVEVRVRFLKPAALQVAMRLDSADGAWRSAYATRVAGRRQLAARSLRGSGSGGWTDSGATDSVSVPARRTAGTCRVSRDGDARSRGGGASPAAGTYRIRGAGCDVCGTELDGVRAVLVNITYIMRRSHEIRSKIASFQQANPGSCEPP